MNYIDITSPDINNGLGCRVTLWISGCPFHCKGCHNPESWDSNFGKEFDINEIINRISEISQKNYIAGLTLCGGEPLWGKTYDELYKLLNLVMWYKKEFPNKNIWVYSGATYEELLNCCIDDALPQSSISKVRGSMYKEILSYCDVLVDGPYMQEQRNITLPFRGSNNQRIIDLNNSKLGKIKLLDIE